MFFFCSLLVLEVCGNDYEFCGTIVRMIFTRSVLFGEVVVTDKVVVAKRTEVKFEDVAASPHAAKDL